MLKRKIVTTAILFVLLAAGITYSQGKSVGTITETNISPDGKSGFTPKPVSQELTSLIKELKKAKNDGNLERIKFYQHQINAFTGASQLQTTPITDIAHPDDIYNGDNLNYTVLHPNHATSSGAVATDRITGTIYAAYTRYILGACDEVYIYKSTSNGLGWTFIRSFSMPTQGELDYRSNELDLEVVNKGDSAYIYGVAAADNGTGVSLGLFFRIRQDGDMLTLRTFGDISSTTIRFRYPRITSDNARYLAGSYVYVSYTMDSVVSGGRKFLKSMFALVEEPFSPVPAFTLMRTSGAGAYAYYTPESQADSAFMQSDICFVNTPGDTDIVATTYIIRGTNVFNGRNHNVAVSNTYGATFSASYAVMDNTFLESPRIASPGYLNKNVMIASRRLFANGDWDPAYYYSTNFNRTIGNFSSVALVESTGDTTLTIDLAARYRSFDHFLFTFADRRGTGNNSIPMARPFKQGALQTFYLVNPSGIFNSASFGAPVAGFRFVNNDSCLVGWANSTGFGYNITGGCGGTMTTLGSNPFTADGYALQQNYPNPFNPATKISFNVKQTGYVKLTVFDIIGKHVTQLVNGQVTAGEHSIDFNAASLPSGVYYYKLEADGFSDVKKMMLVK